MAAGPATHEEAKLVFVQIFATQNIEETIACHGQEPANRKRVGVAWSVEHAEESFLRYVLAELVISATPVHKAIDLMHVRVVEGRNALCSRMSVTHVTTVEHDAADSLGRGAVAKDREGVCGSHSLDGLGDR